LLLGISHDTSPRGPGPSAPQFLGFMRTHLVTEIPNLTWGRTVLGSAMPPISRDRSCGSPIIGVLLYLWLHPLTQNDHIQHGITYGKGHVSHAIVFAQMHHVVYGDSCFLLIDSVDCITTIIAKYAVEIVNFPYMWCWYNGESVIWGLQSHTLFFILQFRTVESLIPESL